MSAYGVVARADVASVVLIVSTSAAFVVFAASAFAGPAMSTTGDTK
jgi:hypothetical protein